MSRHARALLRRRWSRQLVAALGIELHFEGPLPPPGSLIVANHVSWVDIFAINALAPAAFVAKAEVRNWPLIGWLSAHNDTVFLRRGSRGHARLINTEIAALIADGTRVAVFPEGTTTDGSHLLHFHAALLQPAIEAAAPLATVAIRYLDGQGEPCTTAAYIGTVTLWESLRAIVEARGLKLHLTCAPAITTRSMSRKQLSAQAHQTIARHLDRGESLAERRAA